jgi:hypothetical protein
MVKLRGNKLISLSALYTNMETIRGVSEFRIVQEKEDDFFVYIVRTEKGIESIVAEEVNRMLKRVLGDNISIDAKFVESIPREPSGKLRSVISKL